MSSDQMPIYVLYATDCGEYYQLAHMITYI